MIGSDWQVGDKIVCIDPSSRHCGGSPLYASPMCIHLEQDKVYAIQSIMAHNMGGGVSVLLVDVVGIPRFRDGLPNFLTTRFRKVMPDKAEGNKEDFKLLLEQHKSPAKTPAKVPAIISVPPLPAHPFFAPTVPPIKR